MASMRTNPRQEITERTATWISGERDTAVEWADVEIEGFTFAARNDVEWLNEHMAEIFSQNQSKFADIFKTPGKLRGKTPMTSRKLHSGAAREPLSDVFSASPRPGPSPFKPINLERQIAASFQVAEDEPTKLCPPINQSSSPQRNIQTLDSGYHGSQSTEADDQNTFRPLPRTSPIKSPRQLKTAFTDMVSPTRESEGRRTTEGSFQSAREEQTKVINESDLGQQIENSDDTERDISISDDAATVQYPVLRRQQPEHSQSPVAPSLQKLSPQRSTPLGNKLSSKPADSIRGDTNMDEDEQYDETHTPSDGSSPIRPIVRKSSLNFASLPAREPINTKKSIGNRVSRNSHLDQTRTSHYGRQTGGKSLGNISQEDTQHDDDEMGVDSIIEEKVDVDQRIAKIHNKTSTQRLQDQISMLGQSQPQTRPHSKSIPGAALVASQLVQQVGPVAERTSPPKSPQRNGLSVIAPGAFPVDEDDSWIGPPTAAAIPAPAISPRPQMPKSYTTDVMEGIHDKDSIGGSQFNLPKRGENIRENSPLREQPMFEKSANLLGHVKSASTSVIKSPSKVEDLPRHGLHKAISVSNPNPTSSVYSNEESTTPPKSMSRNKGSPLKAAKDKFSSILKTSRGLFASSAAVSAEAKESALSPISARAALGPSFEEAIASRSELTYPSLDHHGITGPIPSPPKSPRKTRASIEREEKRKEDEDKEARRMEDQLEKARAKVREEARQHHAEQERVAAMEKQIAARKEQDEASKASQVDIPRATRTSPRKTKAQLEAEGIAAAAVSSTTSTSEDVEMIDAPASMAPPSLPRPKTASQIGRPGGKRPLRPVKDNLPKPKAPTVIRVDTGSQRGHQYHPSTSSLSASLQDSLAAPVASSQGTLKSKTSSTSLHGKGSAGSFKAGASKVLEAAARKKEQDELALQRKKDAKLEMERQRTALKEEQQRRQETEKQRELQREKEQATIAADAKKAASRQNLEKKRLEMEKAKQTRAPPPAIRSQSNMDVLKDKVLPPVPQREVQGKPNRINTNLQRSQEDSARSVHATLQNNSKAPPKRPLQQDVDDFSSRPTLQRNGPSFQQNETNAKRRKTNEHSDDEDDDTEHQPRMTAPPIRQSSVRQKEIPPKSLFPSGYANTTAANSNLQRSTLITQHNINQSKPAHPLDMAQVSKAPIAFASSSAQSLNQLHKTPARPAGVPKTTAKSAAKSSPRYQNGESIELPEIHTDSEDEESDDGNDFVPSGWTNSPALRKQIEKQETIDPSGIFGQPGPLIMEEVFPTIKERLHKFRARTSSANWSGQDRLTEDEIQKDLQARDRVRREGGWTYDSMV